MFVTSTPTPQIVINGFQYHFQFFLFVSDDEEEAADAGAPTITLSVLFVCFCSPAGVVCGARSPTPYAFSSFCLFLFFVVYLVVLIFYVLLWVLPPTIHWPGESHHKPVGIDQR